MARKPTEGRTAGKLPLGEVWDDVPGVLTAHFPDTSRNWRAALSETFRASLTISSTVGHPCGTISSVQRGPIALHRLDLKQQMLKPKTDLEKEATLVILIPIQGTATYTCRQNRHPIGPGDIIPIRAWDEFELEIGEAFGVVVFTAPFWWVFARGTGPNKLRWLGTDDIYISREFFLAPVLISAIDVLLRNASIGHQAEEASNMVGAIIAHAFNAASSTDTVVHSVRSRFLQIYDFISRNVAQEGLSPKDAADSLHIAVRTLHQACAEKGTTFNKILADMRLNYAAYLLKTSDVRISDVAFTTGYGSLPHFCRQFKEKYGVPASLYRSLIIEESGAAAG